MSYSSHKTLPTVAIVGGGVSGTLVAIQLLRSAITHLEIHLIERRGVFGHGVAYGTQETSSLLNVPTGKMSALPDDPDHFLRWLQATNYKDDSGQSITESSFVPRYLYGNYISDVLDATEHAAKPFVKLVRHRDRVLDIVATSENATLYLESGKQINVTKVVIAFGNYPPRGLAGVDPEVYASDRYVENPWSEHAFERILPDDAVLIIGTGLTMVDIVMGLHTRGHRGSIFAISKHGLLPKSHLLSPTSVVPPNVSDLPNTARQLTRHIRQYIDLMISTHNVDWRVAFDSLRSLTPLLWQRLPLEEKRRLLRHVLPYWDIHRHRIPPKAAAILNVLQSTGQLTVRQGNLKYLKLRPLGIRAEIETHPQGVWSLDVERVVNCTGPNTHYLTLADALVTNLLKRGTARSDHLQLGLDVENSGALRDNVGIASTVLYTIGPTLKGALWEATAVPEIRQQAVDLGKTLLTSFSPGIRLEP